MPIVDVTVAPHVGDDQISRLAEVIPHAVSVAVECPEEPYDGALQPGDVEIRFTRRGPYDVAGLDVLVEVRSKWFASRADNRQERCDGLQEALAAGVEGLSLGVYLELPVAAWSQSE
jgi:hypothetical protein